MPRLKIAVVVIVIIILLSIFVKKRIDKRTFLENLLSDVSVSNLSVDGKAYSVKNGRVEQSPDLFTVLKVLKLAAFYQWNKEDPLYYSPDLNTEEIKKSVENIDNNQNKLLLYINRKEHIYPTDFLKSFANTAEETKVFLAHPSMEEADKLIKEQQETVLNYRKEIRNLSSIITEKNKNNTKYRSIVLLNIKESIETTIDDFKKIDHNADILTQEINSRKNCISGWGSCYRPGKNFKKPDSIINLSKKHLPNLLDKELVFERQKKQLGKLEIKGPYISKTPCFGLDQDLSYPEQYFYLRKDDKNMDIQLATEIYFKKITPQSINEADKYLAEQGVTHNLLRSSTPYMCPFQEHLTEISEMDVFLNKNKPMIFNLKMGNQSLAGDLISKAEAVELKVFNDKYPSYDNFKTLAFYYGYIYRLISEGKQLNKNNISYKDELLKRKIVIDSKLGDFHKILNSLSDMINFTTKVEWNKSRKDVIDTNLYPFRNFYGIMYIPFSPAVYKNELRLEYVDKVYVENAVNIDQQYMSYSQAKTIYSQSEILNWFSISNATNQNFP